MADETDVTTITIDGKDYSAADLTFREQRDYRGLVRELAENPDADLEDLPISDVIPPLIVVLRRRDDPDYSLENALDLKLSDVFREEQNGERPTKRGKKAANSGTPSSTP